MEDVTPEDEKEIEEGIRVIADAFEAAADGAERFLNALRDAGFKEGDDFGAFLRLLMGHKPDDEANPQ